MRTLIKIIMVVILGFMVVSFCTRGNNAYADPMDPLNKIEQGATDTGIGTAIDTDIGEAMTRNTPDMGTVAEIIIVTDADGVAVTDAYGSVVTESMTTTALSQEDFEREENQRKAREFLDSILLLVGVLGVIVPTLYTGVYLGARIMPTIFRPLFLLFTRGQVEAEDIPWYVVFLRMLPVAVLGMMMATGWIKKPFSWIWVLVEEYILR